MKNQENHLQGITGIKSIIENIKRVIIGSIVKNIIKAGVVHIRNHQSHKNCKNHEADPEQFREIEAKVILQYPWSEVKVVKKE